MFTYNCENRKCIKIIIYTLIFSTYSSNSEQTSILILAPLRYARVQSLRLSDGNSDHGLQIGSCSFKQNNHGTSNLPGYRVFQHVRCRFIPAGQARMKAGYFCLELETRQGGQQFGPMYSSHSKNYQF